MQDEDGLCELEVPLFIELKQSSCMNDLGAYSTSSIGADQFIGSFKGKTKKSMSQCGDSTYVWAILSSRQVPLFYIDASDPKDSNWLRFIRTTSDASKYNVICMQQNQQINYFTSKEIKLGDELLTYLPQKKKKTRNKNIINRTYKLVNSNGNHVSKIEESSSSSFSTTSESNKETLNEEPTKKKFKFERLFEETKPSLNDLNGIKIHIEPIETKTSCKHILTDLMLSMENKFEKIKNDIRILKCNICSTLLPTQVTPDSSYLNALKVHYLDKHLVRKTPEVNGDSKDWLTSNVDSAVIDLMNSLLNQIESMFKSENQFKCHICENIFFVDVRSLKSHLAMEHSYDFEDTFNCLFCDKELTRISGLINHLKSSHKESIITNRLISPVCFEHTDLIDSVDLDEFEEAKFNEDITEIKTYDIENEDDSNSVDSSASSSSSSTKPNQKETKKSDFEREGKNRPGRPSNKPAKIMENNSISTSCQASNVKTWTCQMCKKQFEQRVELSKHQCIELNLKLLKKKKEIRKKKWREAHWKRKIDLSYIETTSLTQLSQNIADNLSFCIDGTSEDLKAYSREVKDYINTELGNESHLQMFLRNCFPDVYKKLTTSPSVLSNLDTNLISKANSYFVDSVYIPNKNTSDHQQPAANKSTLSKLTNGSTNGTMPLFNCKNCRVKCRTLAELIQHQRDQHKFTFKTTFDFYNDYLAVNKDDKSCLNWYSSNMYANSPIGYFACDPFSYILNLNWDQTLEKKCPNCEHNFARVKYVKHISNCGKDVENMDEIEMTRHSSLNHLASSNLFDESLSLKSIVKADNSFVNFSEPEDNDDLFAVCSQVIDHLIEIIERDDHVEVKKESHDSNEKKGRNQLRISSRPRRTKKFDRIYLKEKIFSSPSSFNHLEDLKQNKSAVSLKKVREEAPTEIIELVSHKGKSYVCEKCGLEFTSANSVIRHQEKSCLRLKVICLKSKLNKEHKNCPVCGAVFLNANSYNSSTHRLSIHIYKHHKALLGSALTPPSTEAKHLHEIQLRKAQESACLDDC